eukprot:36303-Eustigmatos_ZCMA.PRE.1
MTGMWNPWRCVCDTSLISDRWGWRGAKLTYMAHEESYLCHTESEATAMKECDFGPGGRAMTNEVVGV